jgi:hypothetical protein
MKSNSVHKVFSNPQQYRDLFISKNLIKGDSLFQSSNESERC